MESPAFAGSSRLTCDDRRPREPVLPEFLDEVVLRRLLGEGYADVALRRSGRKVVADVFGRVGPVRVLTTN